MAAVGWGKVSKAEANEMYADVLSDAVDALKRFRTDSRLDPVTLATVISSLESFADEVMEG